MDFNRPELFFVGFVGLWIGILFVIARLGGRATLATFYRLSGSFSGECWRFQSGEMHLFIPWADVSVAPGKRGFLSIYTEFRFRQVPTIPFRVNERLARRMIESAGSPWPGEDVAIQNNFERR